LVLRVFELAPKGRDKSAQGNALGLQATPWVWYYGFSKLAPQGRDKSAQGNALGLQATPWKLDHWTTSSPMP
jgi:hypothetical protein